MREGYVGRYSEFNDVKLIQELVVEHRHQFELSMAQDNVSGADSVSDVSRDLIPVVIDRLAEEDPMAVFVTLASETGLKAITFKQYANAINKVAFWLEHEMGTKPQNGGLAYFGTGGGDIGYAILLIAAVKAGYHVRRVPLSLHTTVADPLLRCSSTLRGTALTLMRICLPWGIAIQLFFPNLNHHMPLRCWLPILCESFKCQTSMSSLMSRLHFMNT